jgi:8-oxo-dGTP pyrophosphatase MutT (NUDIX family)
MKWTIHGERSLYTSDWVGLSLVDIEIPGHERFEHHVVRFPRPASGTVVFDPDRGVLLLWRHRFITDTWGWEIPAGGVDRGETLEQAAERETVEEAGWRPRRLRHLQSYHPVHGTCDQTFAIFLGTDPVYVGPPTDVSESERVEWLPVGKVVEEIQAGHIIDGLSLTALLWCLAFGELTP